MMIATARLFHCDLETPSIHWQLGERYRSFLIQIDVCYDRRAKPHKLLCGCDVGSGGDTEIRPVARSPSLYSAPQQQQYETPLENRTPVPLESASGNPLSGGERTPLRLNDPSRFAMPITHNGPTSRECYLLRYIWQGSQQHSGPHLLRELRSIGWQDRVRYRIGYSRIVTKNIPHCCLAQVVASTANITFDTGRKRREFSTKTTPSYSD
jgi:hypothetical protein